jgi:hypothetical protein
VTRPVNRYDATFLEALPHLSTLIAEPALAERWTDESALAKMSVGSLACHLNSQVVFAHLLLSRPTDFPVLEGGADEHYARAVWTRTISPDDPENDRSRYDEEARAGVLKLRETTATAAAAVTTLLTEGSAGAAAGLPWQGWALTRDAFLLTRMLEIVVHSDDLALSLGIPTPVFGEAVFEPVVQLLTRLSVRRNGQSAVISTLTRRERQRGISAF